MKRGILASAVIALVSVCALVILFVNYLIARNAHREILERFIIEEFVEAPGAITYDIRKKWDGSGATLKVDFAALQEANSDTVAWLQIPRTDISYPVLHADDNDFYTTHGFDKTANTHGAIFLEATNDTSFSDRNSIIYGHAMRDTTMFGSLRAHFSASAEESADPFFYLYLPDGRVNRYLVFSYYDTGDASDAYSTFTADDAYDYYVYYAQTLSQAGVTWEELLRSAGVTDAAGDAEEEREGASTDGASAPKADSIFAGRPPIVTLSTCIGPSGSSRRFVVHGVFCGSVVR